MLKSVVPATGYQGGLTSLVGQPAAPGLRFVGFDLRPTFIGHLASQSKRVAKRIAGELSVG